MTREIERLLRDQVERTAQAFEWTCPCCGRTEEGLTGLLAHRALKAHYIECDVLNYRGAA